MKLRNKLVAVLAASMVVTSVPVVTMADTTNYMSTSRYAQKDSTFGYLNGSYGAYDTVYGQTTGIGDSWSSRGYEYEYSNGFEFKPVFDYSTTDTTYMSLTADSEFNTRAIITYVDAFNSKDRTTHLQFDKDGKVVSANNPEYNGKTADELLRSGVKMYYSTKDASSNPTTVGLSPYLQLPKYHAHATFTYQELLDKATEVAKNRIKAAGDDYYSAISSKDELANYVAKLLGVQYVREMYNGVAAALNQSRVMDIEFDDTGKAVFIIKDKETGEELDTYSGSSRMGMDIVAGSKMLDADKVAKAVNDIVAEYTKNNVITTTYSQLYKSSASSSGSGKTLSADIVDAMDIEMTSWKLQKAIEQGATTYTKFMTSNAVWTGSEKAVAEIRKVDLINWKDANDREYKSHLQITTSGTFKKDVTYRLPVLAKLGGDKVVILDVNGKDSNITSGKYNLTQDALTDKRLTVDADSKTIRTNNADEIGEIRFTESQIKSLTSKGNRRIKITLPASSDLEFNLNKTESNIKVTGKRGFFAINTVDGEDVLEGATTKAEKTDKVLTETTDSKNTVRFYYGKTSRRNEYTDSDRRTLVVELPAWDHKTSVGEMVLTGIYVQPIDEKATPGDVNATIAEYNAKYKDADKKEGIETVANENLIESVTKKVAVVKDYDVTLTCDKPASIKAGRSGIVNEKKATFVLEEVVKDSLVDGRKIKFVVENGYIFGPADIDYRTEAANSNNFNTTGLYGTSGYKERALEKFKELIKEEKIKFEEKAGKDGDKIGFDESTLVLDFDADGRVIGFAAEYPRLKDTEADKIKVTMPVATDVMSKGDVTVKAENLYTRSFQDKKDDPSCVIANITEPIAVTFDGAKLKVGKQAQEAGSITIKETDKGMIENGWLFLAAKDQNGITFDSVPTVTVEGTDGKVLTFKNVALSKDKTILGIEITKESTEAATLKISDIKLTADRTVPEANYDLAIWGTALTDENELGISNFTQNALYNHAYFNQVSDLYTVEKFIQMTTANTEDLSSAAKAVTTQFVIGQKDFTVNGEKQSMDSAAYVKDGLTFVPVRYLAQAFGIAGNAVQYDKATSTATIVAGDKVINITSGKAYLTVNGTQVPMASKAEVKEGRMCVPMAYIAAALGLEKSWDASTKTATFTNVSK